ncbi:hypothetical protein NC99_07770 [Sunxiuqinia dokdonensis]|uniref:Uncharacterized protein n=1 Tax=Sunxiuqinia dokdonensis TaxID=1409788 RepID=A0A0L8VDI0_9BACT|nr:hypothetical protein NC99_07770 [Sunxiuqinia dokdonensis]
MSFNVLLYRWLHPFVDKLVLKHFQARLHYKLTASELNGVYNSINET